MKHGKFDRTQISSQLWHHDCNSLLDNRSIKWTHQGSIVIQCTPQTCRLHSTRLCVLRIYISAVNSLEIAFFTATGHLPSDKLHSEISFPICDKVKVRASSRCDKSRENKLQKLNAENLFSSATLWRKSATRDPIQRTRSFSRKSFIYIYMYIFSI